MSFLLRKDATGKSEEDEAQMQPVPTESAGPMCDCLCHLRGRHRERRARSRGIVSSCRMNHVFVTTHAGLDDSGRLTEGRFKGLSTDWRQFRGDRPEYRRARSFEKAWSPFHRNMNPR